MFYSVRSGTTRTRFANRYSFTLHYITVPVTTAEASQPAPNSLELVAAVVAVTENVAPESYLQSMECLPLPMLPGLWGQRSGRNPLISLDGKPVRPALENKKHPNEIRSVLQLILYKILFSSFVFSFWVPPKDYHTGGNLLFGFLKTYKQTTTKKKKKKNQQQQKQQ